MIRFLGRLEELGIDKDYRFPPAEEASPRVLSAPRQPFTGHAYFGL
jgi:hypothetical protein